MSLYIADVIGVVHEIKNIQTKSDRKKVVVSAKMKDLKYIKFKLISI